MTDITLLSRLRWWATQWPLRQHLVTLVCLTACALMLYRATALRHSVSVLEASSTAAQSVQSSQTRGHQESQDEARQLVAFFPSGEVTEPFLKKTYAATTKTGIDITNVSIEPGNSDLPGLKKTLIRMTLTAEDDGYRRLVHDLLKTTPYVSLLRMSISRNEQGTFMADLTWGAYSR